MTFDRPYLLIALVAVPLAAVAIATLEARRAMRSGAWSRPAMLPNVVRRPARAMRWIPLVLFLVGLTLLLVGFARPNRVLTDIHSGEGTVVLAFDVSGSMAAGDVGATRIQAARAVARRFLNDLPASDRVAILTFGDRVRIPVAPTFDHQRAIAHLPAKVTPRSGTSLGDAISAAVDVVLQSVGRSEAGSKPGAVLLISDGDQTAAGTTPAAAADIAFVDGIPINTLTLGTSKGIVTQPLTVDGFRTSIQISVPALPGAMAKLAQQTGGSSFTAATPAEVRAAGDDVATVYKSLVPPIVLTKRDQPLSRATAAAAIGFILAGIAVSAFWFGKVA